MKTQILLVDDNEDFLDSTRDVLENEDYNVVAATTGEHALDLMAAKVFDIVLMDIKMPGLNGVEIFAKMKENNPGIRVIFFTAYALGDLIRRAHEEGACAVLNKPLDMNVLLKTVEENCENRDCQCVLLVDDDKSFCDNIRDALSQAGYKVVVAYDSEDAVKKAQQKSYDILLLDMKLSPQNGLETWRRIRPLQPDLVAIIISGYAEQMQHMIREALNENVCSSLPKPVDMDLLLRLLKDISQQAKNRIFRNGKT